MSQNYNRGLENEYLVPYITFTQDPTGSAISSAKLTVSPALPDGKTQIDLTQAFTSFASNKEYTLTPNTTFEATLTLHGAAGGSGGNTANVGGRGGNVTGTVKFESGSSYILVVGGKGGAYGGRTSGLVGYGGTGGKGDPTGDPDDLEKYAGDGGGLTGIFKTSVTQGNALLIAGGGGGGSGGASSQDTGGDGGGTSGGWGEGSRELNGIGRGADGGTQTAGGSNNTFTYHHGHELWGGDGQFDPTGDDDDISGGGGGGGYYGGGGAYRQDGGYRAGGGGGGSGYISVDTSIVSNASFGSTTGTLVDTFSQSGFPTYNTGTGSIDPNSTAYPLEQAFDGDTSTYANMSYAVGENTYTKLTFTEPIDNLVDIRVGYDGAGHVGYNTSASAQGSGATGSREEIVLYNDGSNPIELTNLYFITQSGTSGYCRLYDVSIQKSGGSLTTCTYVAAATNRSGGTASLTAIASAGAGVTGLTAVATASTGNGYIQYQWYQDDSTLGGITTAYSGIGTTKDISIEFSGTGKSKQVPFKVSATWVPENPAQIVSHGTPGVGATGVGLGQSITGYSPDGETFSAVGIVTVSPSITVTLDDTNGQPIGYNTSAYNTPRNISVTDSISNGDSANLAYQWYNASGPLAIAGANSSGYTFTPGYVGVNTYYCVVSYPSDPLVPSVTSDSITDNATDLSQTIRIEVVPAGAEKRASSSDYIVYSIDVDLSNHKDGYKLDVNKVQDIVASRGGTRNTSTYAWGNYYYVSVFAIDDDITVDLEMGGAQGHSNDNHTGGDGGWMVIQGILEQNKELFLIAAQGNRNVDIPATAAYYMGSVIGIVGNGGGAGVSQRGGSGGANSSGTNSLGGSSGGSFYASNTLPTEGASVINIGSGEPRASRCPKGSQWYQNRYSPCETWTESVADPDGFQYFEHGGSINTHIDRGFKMTNTYLINGSTDASGKGGSGATGGAGDPNSGGGGGSGYYGGNWTLLGSGTAQNDGNVRDWEYGPNLKQNVTTDGVNGYIRIFGRGGTAGNNPIVTNNLAKIRRNPSELSNKNGLWLDLTDFPANEEVLIRGTVTNNSSGHFLSMYITDWGGYEYNLNGDSDTERGGMCGSNGRIAYGCDLIKMTINENSGTVDAWLPGGQNAYYIFRSHDHSAHSSGIYKGGENQGGGAGIASGGEFDITVHDSSPSGGDNNTGGSADLRVAFSIQGTRRI